MIKVSLTAVCRQNWLITSLLLILIWAVSQEKAVRAAIPTGMLCDDCHTMHNSQDGAAVVSLYNRSTNQFEESTNPQASLLKKDCIACHMGTNNGSNETPYVFSTTQPSYGTTGSEGNTLAGGSFYCVANGDNAAGHNVEGVSAQDPPSPTGLGLTPPGGTAMTSQLTCAGKNGCHGDRDPTITTQTEAMHRTHHPIQAQQEVDGSTVAESYRFLDGIAGYEDSDWEYQADKNNHNQYKGSDRSWDTDDPADTISHFCSQCHQNFHQGNIAASQTDEMTSPWLRHPVDFDMGNTAAGSEYRSYGGELINDYDVAVPVASSDISQVKTNVTFSDDTIITCITCHRAHGSPYYKGLRWDYGSTNLSTSLNGCIRCHTSKN